MAFGLTELRSMWVCPSSLLSDSRISFKGLDWLIVGEPSKGEVRPLPASVITSPSLILEFESLWFRFEAAACTAYPCGSTDGICFIETDFWDESCFWGAITFSMSLPDGDFWWDNFCNCFDEKGLLVSLRSDFLPLLEFLGLLESLPA